LTEKRYWSTIPALIQENTAIEDNRITEIHNENSARQKNIVGKVEECNHWRNTTLMQFEKIASRATSAPSFAI
jgi:hypothetical protein